MKPVFVPVAEEPFRRYLAGVKGAEVRNIYRKNGFRNGLASTVQRDGSEGRPVTIRWGYAAGRPELRGTLGRVWIAPSWRHLSDEARRLVASDSPGDYIDAYQPLVAFEIRLPNNQAGGGQA